MDTGEAVHYVDAAGYVVHGTGFYVAESAAEQLIVLIEFVRFRANCLAGEVEASIILQMLRVYHSLGDALAIRKHTVEMACDGKVFDVAIHKNMKIFALRPL